LRLPGKTPRGRVQVPGAREFGAVSCKSGANDSNTPEPRWGIGSATGERQPLGSNVEGIRRVRIEVEMWLTVHPVQFGCCRRTP